LVEHDCVEEYFVGLLHGVGKEAFERHLATCDRCRTLLKRLRQLDAELHEGLPRTLPSEEVLNEWVKELLSKLTEQGKLRG
jgi:anti-sigma factor RsiW